MPSGLRLLLTICLLCLPFAAVRAQHQLQLDVARFRSTDVAVKGGTVEIYATVSGKHLTYQRRGPKLFQAGATVTLEAVRPDGSAIYQETITLRPPVLRDTTAAIKNPISFQKRITLPEGRYILRGHLRDQYRAANTDIVERPLVMEFSSTKPGLSDVVLLSKPASRSTVEANNFIRNGLSLTRTPGGLYARGMDKLYFYAELYNASAGQPLVLRYRLRAAKTTKDAVASQGATQGAEGRPTVLTGELDLTKVPAGEYLLTLEIRNAKNQVLTTQTTTVRRNPADYAPAGAVMPR
ncbi:hypothetical protein HNQ93_001931 [Hymenobacter luteus]|uniref:Uncharacterized protein n=2 Tax=Hymenobacter TaxID=89966 RepID=A0A7W9T182_9BACT|nr:MULTISPECIES: hypothetical protein [Hymenobacter]MBB4600708.1 hypothetical protein [Hymenobacter latericoloratus]MBB6059085.1 hypothetical protein [Hymenobacter luteus]